MVPNWHGEWPLSAHPDYCRLVRESSDELLLHGYCHQRLRGWGPTTLLTGAGDEMNGLELEEPDAPSSADSGSSPRSSESRHEAFSHRPGRRGTCAWGTEMAWGWITSWAFFPSNHARAERFLWRPGAGTVVAGVGSDTSVIGSGGCLSRWIEESPPWRFTERFGAGFLAEDPPAHPGPRQDWVRTEHTRRGCSRRVMLKSILDAVMERRAPSVDGTGGCVAAD